MINATSAAATRRTPNSPLPIRSALHYQYAPTNHIKTTFAAPFTPKKQRLHAQLQQSYSMMTSIGSSSLFHETANTQPCSYAAGVQSISSSSQRRSTSPIPIKTPERLLSPIRSPISPSSTKRRSQGRRAIEQISKSNHAKNSSSNNPNVQNISEEFEYLKNRIKHVEISNSAIINKISRLERSDDSRSKENHLKIIPQTSISPYLSAQRNSFDRLIRPVKQSTEPSDFQSQAHLKHSNSCPKQQPQLSSQSHLPDAAASAQKQSQIDHNNGKEKYIQSVEEEQSYKREIKSVIMAKDEEIHSLRVTNDQLSADLRSYRHTSAALSVKNNSLTNRLEELQRKLEESQEQLIQVITSNVSLSRIAELEGEIAAKDVMIDSLRSGQFEPSKHTPHFQHKRKIDIEKRRDQLIQMLSAEGHGNQALSLPVEQRKEMQQQVDSLNNEILSIIEDQAKLQQHSHRKRNNSPFELYAASSASQRSKRTQSSGQVFEYITTENQVSNLVSSAEKRIEQLTEVIRSAENEKRSFLHACNTIVHEKRRDNVKISDFEAVLQCLRDDCIACVQCHSLLEQMTYQEHAIKEVQASFTDLSQRYEKEKNKGHVEKQQLLLKMNEMASELNSFQEMSNGHGDSTNYNQLIGLYQQQQAHLTQIVEQKNQNESTLMESQQENRQMRIKLDKMSVELARLQQINLDQTQKLLTLQKAGQLAILSGQSQANSSIEDVNNAKKMDSVIRDKEAAEKVIVELKGQLESLGVRYSQLNANQRDTIQTKDVQLRKLQLRIQSLTARNTANSIRSLSVEDESSEYRGPHTSRDEVITSYRQQESTQVSVASRSVSPMVELNVVSADQRDEMIVGLREKIEILEADLKGITSSKHEGDVMNEQLNIQHRAIQEQFRDLQQQMEVVKSRNCEITVLLNAAEDAKKLLLVKNEGVVKQLGQFEQQVSQLKESVKLKQQEVNDGEQLLNEIESDYQRLLSQAEIQLDQLRSRCEAQTREVDVVKREALKAKQDYEGKCREFEENMRSEKEQLRQELQQWYDDQRMSVDGKVVELEKKLVDAGEKYSGTQTEVDQLQQNAVQRESMFQRQREQMLAELENVQVQLLAAKQNEETLVSQVKQQVDIIQQYEMQIKQSQQQQSERAKDLLVEIEEYKSKVSQIEDACRQANERVRILLIEVEQSESEKVQIVTNHAKCIEEFKTVIGEREIYINGKDQRIIEQDEVIAGKSALIAERDLEILEMRSRESTNTVDKLSLQEQINELKCGISNRDNQISALSEQLSLSISQSTEEQRKSVDKFEAAQLKAQQLLDKQSVQIKQLIDSAANEVSQKDKAIVELNAALRQVEDCRRQVDQLSAENVRQSELITSSMKSQQLLVQSLQNQVDTQIALRSSEMEAQSIKHKAELEAMSSDLKLLESDIKAIESQLDDAHGVIQARDALITDLTKKFQDFQRARQKELKEQICKSCDELQMRVSTSDRLITELRSQLVMNKDVETVLRTELSEVRRQHDKQQQQFRNSETELAVVLDEDDTDLLYQQVNALKLSLQVQSKQIEQQEWRISEFMRQKDEADSTLKQAVDYSTQLSSALKGSQRELEFYKRSSKECSHRNIVMANTSIEEEKGSENFNQMIEDITNICDQLVKQDDGLDEQQSSSRSSVEIQINIHDLQSTSFHQTGNLNLRKSSKASITDNYSDQERFAEDYKDTNGGAAAGGVSEVAIGRKNGKVMFADAADQDLSSIQKSVASPQNIMLQVNLRTQLGSMDATRVFWAELTEAFMKEVNEIDVYGKQQQQQVDENAKDLLGRCFANLSDTFISEYLIRINENFLDRLVRKFSEVLERILLGLQCEDEIMQVKNNWSSELAHSLDALVDRLGGSRPSTNLVSFDSIHFVEVESLKKQNSQLKADLKEMAANEVRLQNQFLLVRKDSLQKSEDATHGLRSTLRAIFSKLLAVSQSIDIYLFYNLNGKEVIQNYVKRFEKAFDSSTVSERQQYLNVILNLLEYSEPEKEALLQKHAAAAKKKKTWF